MDRNRYLTATVSCSCCREYTGHTRPVFYVDAQGQLWFKPRLFQPPVLATPEDLVAVLDYLERQALAEAGWVRHADGTLHWTFCAHCGAELPEEDEEDEGQ